MTSQTWREMVDRTRELEMALGSSVKGIAQNEQETVVVQRRCLRATHPLAAGTTLETAMLEALRPAPRDGITPFELPKLLGRRLTRALETGEHLTWADLAEGNVSVSASDLQCGVAGRQPETYVSAPLVP